MVRILWGFSELSREEEEFIGRGAALLGLSYRYFRPLPLDAPMPVLLLEKSRLPAWGCLDCTPRWIDLHHLALEQREAFTAKLAALNAGDFERAATYRRTEEGIEEEQEAELLRLLRELIGKEATGGGGFRR